MRTLALSLAGSIAVLFAGLMLFQRRLYAAALCFLAVLLQISAIFYLLGAQLLAFLQIVVYAGAIMVLIVVAIMATPPQAKTLWAELDVPRPLVPLGLLLLLLEVAMIGLGTVPPSAGAAFAPWPTLQSDFGRELFGRLGTLTELVGVLMLLAALAVVETSKTE